MTSDELGILVDMGICMAVYTMALKCSDEQIDAFFIMIPERFKLQGFKDEIIKEMVENMKKVVLETKNGI